MRAGYRGYAGRYLRVDLTRGKMMDIQTEGWRCELYLGGDGFGTKVLWDEVPQGTDPFGPENRVIFAVGPLTGTLWPCSGRYEVIGKSPLTGIFGDTNSGGHFGNELKFAGYDMVILQGRSKRPVYLWIEDGHAELRDARHLWGKTTSETEDIIRKDLNDREVRIASIGIAGENKVRLAAIISEGRAAARTGLGAVMGSKGIKCIAVKGTGDVSVASDEFYDYASEVREKVLANEFTPGESRYGTPILVTLMSDIGRFPTKNFQRGDFPYAEEISAEALERDHLIKRRACYLCPIGCGRVVEVREGPYKGLVTEGIEYETLNALGSRTWNRYLPSILKADRLCDDYGLDAISTGGVIAFAMECYEKGILTREDTGGLDLTWGNYEAEIQLIEMIARREGIGNLLAEGVRTASQRIGKGSEYYAMHVKGLEIPAQDPRAQQSMGLTHIAASRGADHLKGFPTIDETGYVKEAVERYGERYLPEIIDGTTPRYKAMVVKDGEELSAIADSAVTCKFTTHFPPCYYWAELAKGIGLATGMRLDVSGLKRIGERIVNLQRCFNVREGIGRKDDTEPRRLLTEKGTRRARDHVVYQGYMLSRYYELRGWDKDMGWPTRKRLKELGLEDAADELGRMGRLGGSATGKGRA